MIDRLDHDYTVEKLKEMVRIRSVVGEEGELATYLRDELDALGLKGELREVEPGRPNVYARIRGKAPGRRLMFNGHTDTVPVCEGWLTDPFEPVVKDGRVHGLGSCDMKAGIACTLTALKAFAESGFDFHGEIAFTGVIDEEAYSKGAKALLETEYARCDAIILGEPYPGDESKPIPLGITGKILYDVTVKGRAAHGFRPQQGVNAIEQAAMIITSLDKLRMQSHPRFGRGNLCTLKIEGGYKVYSVVVPDRCRFDQAQRERRRAGADRPVAVQQMLVRAIELRAEHVRLRFRRGARQAWRTVPLRLHRRTGSALGSRPDGEVRLRRLSASQVGTVGQRI